MSEIITITYIRSPMWRPENPEQAKELIGGTMMMVEDVSIEEKGHVVDMLDEKCYQIKFDTLEDIQRFVERSDGTKFKFYRSSVHMYTLTKKEE